MTNRVEFDIRPAEAGDHPALLDLSARLTVGIAPWRDPAKVATAVRGWVTSSLEAAGQDGHDVLVALLGNEVAGLVSLAEREHFTGSWTPTSVSSPSVPPLRDMGPDGH